MPYKSCLVCSESVSVNHFGPYLEKHGLSVEEYYLQYSNPSSSSSCARGNKLKFFGMKHGFSKYCEVNCPCHREATTSSNLVRTPDQVAESIRKGAASKRTRMQEDPQFSESYRKALGENGRKSRIAYNKSEKNKETNRNNRLKNWKDPAYREKMSKVAQSPRCYTPEGMQALQLRGKQMAQQFNSTDEKRKALSEKIALRILEGKGPRSGHRGTLCEYRGHRFRSTWEMEFAQALDQVNVEWEYEPVAVPYHDEAGRVRKYLPDFFIPQANTYVEIHPDAFWDERMTSKIASIRKVLDSPIYVLTKQKFLVSFAQAMHMKIVTETMRRAA